MSLETKRAEMFGIQKTSNLMLFFLSKILSTFGQSKIKLKTAKAHIDWLTLLSGGRYEG